MKTRYRIVADRFCGYEVQVKKWWFPFWVQAHAPGYISNTHVSIDDAKLFIKSHRDKGCVIFEEPTNDQA